MKLHSLNIQHFRAIENSQFDFTDHFSQPKQMNLIVGPNGSGKTSILDAILIVVRTIEEPSRPRLRDALEFSVSQLVQGTDKQAKIVFEYSIEEDEARAIHEVYRLLNLPQKPLKLDQNEQVLSIPTVVTWKFPAEMEGTVNDSPTWIHAEEGGFFASATSSINRLGIRGKIAKGMSKNQIRRDSRLLERVGDVCYLDQRRSLHATQKYSLEPNPENLPLDDVLSWLRVYYLKHLTWNTEK